MTRSILAGLLGILSIGAIGALPLACQSGGIGDPCTPEDEYDADFAGFKVTEENIESRSFQCSTRICLVNHFQGRVTCPMGQKAPTPCLPKDVNNPGNDAGNCEELHEPAGSMCVVATTTADDCDPTAAVNQCQAGATCNKARKVCECTLDTDTARCVHSDPKDLGSLKVLKSFVCHKPGDCQVETDTPAKNAGKACCVPGTDTPTTSAVCGQCANSPTVKTHRSADQSVYCSCRCGVADGAAAEPDFNFCECPTGFSCSQIRPDVGLGDPLIAGKYCIKESTEFKVGALDCPNVAKGAYVDPSADTCKGTPLTQ